MDNPFTITIFNASFARVGWVNDPTSLEVVARHNAIGTASIVLPTSHRQLPNLVADGARVLITYLGEFLLSGYVQSFSAEGPTATGLITITVQDDIWLLWRMLGWPVPGALINAQGVKKDTRTGPAETVLKAFVTANKVHLIDNVTVAPDLGRGTSITAESRMAILAEAVVDLVDKAGIGITVRQSGTGLRLDCYTPATFRHTLSEDAGTILNWNWSRTFDSTTRVVIGGPNTDTSREFRTLTATARETSLKYTIETLVDGQSAENYVGMDKVGQDALNAAGPKSGFALTLSDGGPFHYGAGGVHVGDKVTIKIGTQLFTDVLREVTLAFDSDNGLVVTPTIGEHTDDPDKTIAQRLAALARGIRDLRTR